MKRTLLNILATTLLLSACASKADYVTYEVNLNLGLEECLTSQIMATAKPSSDNIYYLIAPYEIGCGMSLEEFMDFRLKFLKGFYDMQCEQWKDQEYKCSFADYCLNYASSSVVFKNLKSGADHLLAGCCINPETCEIVGSIQTMPFRTMDIKDFHGSRLELDFMFIDDIRTHSTKYYVRPTIHGLLCKDYYVLEFCVSKDVLEAKYDGKLKNYVKEFMEWRIENGLTVDSYLRKDISMRYYDYNDEYQAERFEEGKTYVLWAVPFCEDYLDHIYSLTFTFTPGMCIKYSHDKVTR